MRILKIAIILAILVTGAALFANRYWSVDTRNALGQALEAYQAGRYSESEKILAEIGPRLPQGQYALYSAYVFRSEQQFDKSDAALARAESSTDKGPLALEIALNQSYNGYLTEDHETFVAGLNRARQIDSNNSWVRFFGLMDDFCQMNYSKVQNHWQTDIPTEALSEWMQKSFRETFTPLWFSLKLSRCQIENGHINAARKALKEITLQPSTYDMNQIHLLMGLSYLKEAESAAPTSALLSYKLAFSYFDQLSMQSEEFASERQKISEQLIATITVLLEAHNYSDLSFYIANLQKFKDDVEIEKLATYLISQINLEIDQEQWEQFHDVLAQLAPVMPAGKVRAEISVRLEDLAQDALYTNDLTHLPLYVESALLFTDNKKAFMESLESIVNSKIGELVITDDQNLSQITPYVTVWKDIERDNENRFQFANVLLMYSEQYWHRDHQEQKAMNLMKMAAAIPSVHDKARFHQSIAQMIQRVSSVAVKSDDVNKLPYLWTAVRTYDLSKDLLVDKKVLANYLVDAQYLYNEKRTIDASKVTDWLLLLDPTNQKARALAAKIDYSEANYARALENYHLLGNLDKAEQEQVGVCQVLVGNRKTGLQILADLRKKQELNEETYFRVGMGLLAQGQTIDAMAWMKQIKDPNDEVKAAFVFANYKQNNYGAAVAQYSQLAGRLAGIEGLEEIVVMSNIAMNNQIEAEEMLQNLLTKNREPSPDYESTAFKNFKQKQLNLYDKSYVAAAYYKDMGQDPREALNHLQKLERPTADQLLEIGELALSLGEYQLASVDLGKLVKEPTYRNRALPLFAAVYAKTGQLFESLKLYQEYFAQASPDPKYFPDYRQLLVSLKRYDLILKYYQDHGLSLQEDLIQQCLANIYTNHFDIAKEKAAHLLTLTLSSQDKLRVAQAMLIAGESVSSAKLVKAIAAEVNPSEGTIQELMNYYLVSGNYDKATELAKRAHHQLMASPQGIIVLAKLKVRLSQNDEALVLANQAYQLAPEDPNVLQFILRNESNVEALTGWVAKLRKQLEANIKDTSLQIAYADAVNHLIIEAHHQDKPIDQYVGDLNQAKYLLDSLVQRYPEIPLIQFTAGEYSLLAGNLDSALEFVNKALNLDASYVDGYLYKGIVLEALGQSLGAVEAVKSAVKFSPDDAEAWQELYDLYNSHGIFLDAISALRQAIKYRPNESKSYMKLATLYLSLNNPEQAKETLTLALKHAPDNVDLMKLLLKTLYDPNLAHAFLGQDDLKLEQQMLYKRLAEIDPKAADQLQSEIQEK